MSITDYFKRIRFKYLHLKYKYNLIYNNSSLSRKEKDEMIEEMLAKEGVNNTLDFILYFFNN